ncbi:MAG: type I DNA topoisomerase [Deltaproteobacteria bacterium]|nr:type I DNA topoisomerase [Deltaproteobacteria bacterium]MBW2071979.1 type I DNA topoisomerase [Deltaproteobacteria bacterium]
MAKSLLIVESPTKARTLSRYLGKNFLIQASVGHVKDLPENNLGIDIEHGFEPHYEVIKGKEKVLRSLRKAARNAEAIYLAPDPDREGEAIAWHIAEELQAGDKQIYRVLINEFTRRAIEEALRKPSSLDRHRYEAQQARRLLDRLVGYQISPILWDKVKRGLSAGRVQSVALRLVCEREAEIQAFESEEYWTITAALEGPEPPPFEARLWKRGGKRLTIANEAQANDLVKILEKATYTVTKVDKKSRKRAPAPPFITSTLQQEAARKLRFTAQRTMATAQRLYEGIELGDQGAVGLITYMRTDSTRVAGEAVAEARDWIVQELGKEYLPQKARVYRSRKGAQDAHEAIRPTSVARTPEKVAPYLNKQELALYQLIWKRFVASQMSQALFDHTVVEIAAADLLLRATGTILRFPGFMKLYIEGTDNGEENERETAKLPDLQEGAVLRLRQLLPKQHFTQPPPRFTEATLIRELEEKGIGRPSTYANILAVIQNKEYTVKEKGRFRPTELGMLVNNLLVNSFPEVLDVAFTAQMEANLDRVETGDTGWRQVIEKFYEQFQQTLQQAQLKMPDVKREGLPTDIDCELCGRKMHIRWGKNGAFLSCSGYPTCRNSKNFTRDDKGRIQLAASGEVKGTCELCGRDMVVKEGRFGPFLACSGYPQCKNTRSLQTEDQGDNDKEVRRTDKICEKCGGHFLVKKSRRGGLFLACENYPKCRNTRPMGTGVACPRSECDGELVERRSKRGKIFYGCSKYPDCRFVLWSRPFPRACPQCGSSYLLVRKQKNGKRQLVCPEKSCGYTEPLPAEAMVDSE